MARSTTAGGGAPSEGRTRDFAEAKKRQGARNDLKKADPTPKLAEGKGGETRDELAKMANVSHSTLAKVEKIVASAESEVVEATAGLMSAVREAAALAARRKRRVIARSWPHWRRRGRAESANSRLKRPAARSAHFGRLLARPPSEKRLKRKFAGGVFRM